MDLSNDHEREKIHSVGEKVFDLVLQYGGSLSGEHNDGLVRSAYLKQQFGEDGYKIFKEIKHIFDPDNIFNPRKKIDVTTEYSSKYLIKDNPAQKQAS
jgi:FAD/FMN-containing dehydrogenase